MTGPARGTAYRVERTTLSDQRTLVVRGTVGAQDIPDFMGRAFARVAEVARQDGIALVGLPFGRFRPSGDGRLDLEAGFPVAGVVLGQGDVKASHLPGGPVLRTTHLGDYSGTPGAHEALHEFAASHGLRPAGDAWEVYLSEPDVPEPKTLVVLPVEPIGSQASSVSTT